MARAARICLEVGCGQVAGKSGRCPEHQRSEDARQWRSVPTKATRDYAEAKRRSMAVEEHRLRYGDWCMGYQRPPHEASDLTAQHVEAIGLGGAPGGRLTVWCRSCNSRHGADVRNAVR